jgi:TonB-linked SusC/RagA family outer membrane protein
MRNLFIITFALIFAFAGSAFAQQRTVTGTVTSASDGLPLPGVTVVVQGSPGIGTVTNADGEYSLRAPEGSESLVFSFIGMETQTVSIGTSSVINVVLETSTEALDEVVVTAFGIKREKKALGYSVQEIKTEELTEAREVNVVNSLKGKVAGVHINASSSGGAGGSSYVVIRGNSSLTGDNKPLFIVDGVPIDNQTLDQPNSFNGFDYGDGIGNINPDNIESVSVLKGPSAAALYGARGANGVILITTKSGQLRRGIGVDVNSNFTFENPSVNPTFQNTWGGGYDDNYTSFGTRTIDGQEVSVWPGWLLDQWGGRMDGRPIVYDYAPEWGVQSYTPQPADNVENFYRTGSTFTNTVAVSGGNENSAFRLSVSDMRNKSIVPNSSLERQSISLKASSQISEKLFAEGKIDYTKQTGNNRVQNGISLINLPASLAVLSRSVDLDWMKDYTKENGRMQNYKSGSPYNPYWITNKMKNNDTRDRVMGMALIRYDFTDWLSIQGRTGTDFYNDRRFSMIPQGTPGAANLNGQVQNTMWNVKEENSDVLLTATGDLSSDFSGTFSAGANHLNREAEVVAVRGENLSVPELYHINYASLVFPRNYLERKKINSVYFAGQLGYKNYLFLDITGRNDWSSTLGINNQSFFYPSVSTSFVLTDAIEMDSKVLTFAKLRASYAEAGNDADPYRTMTGYSYSTVSFDGLRMATISNLVPMPDLKNELTRAYELGVDVRLFGNRLGIDFTYYDQSTSNQILPVEVSAATGFNNRMINAGEIQNRGMELMLNASIVKVGGFNWDMGLNLARNRSEVVSLAPGIESHTLLSGDGTIEARVGESYGNIVGRKILRNEAGQIVVNSQGKWQRTEEMTVLGNIQPDLLGGLTNVFSYKGISLSALLDIRVGGQVYSYSKYDQMAKGTGKFTEARDPEDLIIDGVIEDPNGDIVVGDKTYRKNDIQILSHQYYAEQGPWGGIAETMVIDADYLTLREVTLGYSLPTEILQSTPFTKAKFSIVGRNLFYLYRDPQFELMGISQESAFNTEAYAQGVEARGLPTTRSFGFNLSLSF